MVVVRGFGCENLRDKRQPGRGKAQRRRCDRKRLEATPQHTCHFPQVICALESFERLHA